MVGHMLRKGSAVSFSVLALVLTGCGRNPRADAAQGIVKVLAAVQHDDRPAIEAGIDRPALRENLRDQLADLGRAHGIDVGGGASEFALDRMITAQAIQRAQAHAGLPPTPTIAQVGPLLRVADRTHVCVVPAGQSACSLSFAKHDGAWRLVGMPAIGAADP
jgi:hypothetical protein